MKEKRCKLAEPLKVVRFDGPAKGHIETLPAGAMLEVVGKATASGFVQVVCDDVVYNAFEEDIRSRSSGDPSQQASWCGI